jgi:hypothetical protein
MNKIEKFLLWLYAFACLSQIVSLQMQINRLENKIEIIEKEKR